MSKKSPPASTMQNNTTTTEQNAKVTDTVKTMGLRARLATISDTLDGVLPPARLQEMMEDGFNAVKVEMRKSGPLEVKDYTARRDYLRLWLEMQKKVTEKLDEYDESDEGNTSSPLTFEELEVRLRENPAARQKLMEILGA